MLLLFSAPVFLLWAGLSPHILPTNVIEGAFFVLIGLPSFLVLTVGALQMFGPSAYRSMRGTSDDEFDQQLEWDDTWLTHRGLKKVQIEVAGPDNPHSDISLLSPPIALRCGKFRREKEWDVLLPESRIRWILRNDGEPRFGIYAFVALYHAQHHVGYYACHYDVPSGVLLWEYCADVHYKDVVALISQETAERWIPWPFWWDAFFDLMGVFKSVRVLREILTGIFIRLQRPNDFVLRSFGLLLTSGGSLNVPFPTSKGITKGGTLLRETETVAEEALATLRALLREKRQSLVRILPSEPY